MKIPQISKKIGSNKYTTTFNSAQLLNKLEYYIIQFRLAFHCFEKIIYKN